MEEMEFGDAGIPTVFYLNVDHLDENGGDMEEIIGLGEDVQLVQHEDEEEEDATFPTHHYSVQEDGSIQYHHNGEMELDPLEGLGGTGEDDHHDIGGESLVDYEFEDVTPMPTCSDVNVSFSSYTPVVSNFKTASSPSVTVSVPNGGHIKIEPMLKNAFLKSNYTTHTNHQPQQLPHQPKKKRLSGSGANISTLVRTQRVGHPQSVEKRPKLVINLYEEEIGYEFGSLLKDEKTVSQMSHLIPYSEGDYFLRCIDREEIPVKAVKHLAPYLKWRRGHLLAEIRDYRRFSKPLPTSSSTNGSIGRSRSTHSKGSNCNIKLRITTPVVIPATLPAPVITDVLLRPTTNSILQDFEGVIRKSIKARERWKNNKKGIVKTNPQQSKLKTNFKVESEDEEDVDEGGEDDKDSDCELEFDLPSSLSDNEENDILTYEQRLELEKQFINKTAGPLCLDPSPKVALTMNRIQYERFKWNSPTLTPKRLSSKVVENEISNEDMTKQRKSMISFLNFVHSAREKEKLSSGIKEDPLKLHSSTYVEYPTLDPLTNIEEIEKLFPRPEPCTIRSMKVENVSTKIEEYVLETERRKRPHITKLTIFQRNNMESFFGELEMESISDPGPTVMSKTAVGNHQTSTKCQFELGSSQSVSLYVKQFTDIFTEDGRRPCKITYQKVGQPQPQVVYTSSYKQQQQQAASSSSTNPTGSPASAAATSPAGSGPGPVTSSAATTTGPPPPATTVAAIPITTVTAVTTQTQPPVQIVHPQPRTVQAVPSPTAGQPQDQQITLPQNISVVNPTINYNSNHNQQILTRPQIMKQPTVTGTVQPTPNFSHQQILQQKLLRLKQQQQQQQQAALAQPQQQQPQTALAKLLLTNAQQNSTSSGGTTGSSRPITVAVQPQPQKAVTTELQSQAMAQSGNVNVSVNAGGGQGVSVNLNQVMIDGLGGIITSTNPSQIRTQHQLPQGVNILRVNQQGANQVVSSGGAVTLSQPQQVVGHASGPGATIVTSTAGQLQRHQQYQGQTSLSALLQSQPQPQQPTQQRILINANNGQQITLSSPAAATGGTTEIDELSVPDLSSLLATSAAPSSIQQHIIPSTHQTTTVDATHNLNLNLNVNLNSGSVITTTDAVNSSAHGQGPPPFLVFISPLRSVPLSINANQTVTRSTSGTATTLLQQHLSAAPQQATANSLSLSLHQSTSDANQTIVASGMAPISVQRHPQHMKVESSGDVFTFDSSGQHPEIKLEPGVENASVMIGNTTYSVSVSSGGGGNGNQTNSADQRDPGVITLSDLLGSSSAPVTSTSSSSLSSLILQNSSSQQQIVVSTPSSTSPLSATPRLSALLAGTPSADTTNTRSSSGPGGASNDRTLLDRLAASLSSNSTATSSTTTNLSSRTGLNPIATATPSVILDHPVLAATLTGSQPSPKIAPAYRQIAPAPTNAPGGGRKHT